MNRGLVTSCYLSFQRLLSSQAYALFFKQQLAFPLHCYMPPQASQDAVYLCVRSDSLIELFLISLEGLWVVDFVSCAAVL